MKKYLAIILGLLLTGCNQLAMLSVAGSTASLVINNNALVKTYSGLDVATFMSTDKDIKTHAYEIVTNMKKVANETFILEKPPMIESEKKVLVSLPIIEVKIKAIEWKIEAEGWKKAYSKYYE